MANIPVERTSSTPWWLWLLGLLLLALLVWFLVGLLGDDDDELVDADPIEAIDDELGLDLSEVYVSRVVGDNTFFVTPDDGSGPETLVYLEEEPDPTDNVEGRYDVTEGQRISITGTMMDVGDTDLSEWGLTPDQVSLVDDEYVRATSLTILDGDAGIDGDLTSLVALSQAIADGDAGRMVSVTGATVTALAGDSTFYVGDGTNRALVVLEDLGESENGPGTGADGVFDIDVGDTITLRGTVEAFQRGMRGTSSLGDTDAAEAEGRRYVVVVDERGELTMN